MKQSTGKIGQLITGRYQLAEKIAVGDTATLWRSIVKGSTQFTGPVAIKVMEPSFGLLDRHIAMFLEDARIGSTLQHPHLVQVLDFFLFQRTYYLVLEWVEGVDLAGFVASYRMVGQQVPWHLIAYVAIGVLRGLVAAHERDVIHGEVSPRNVLLGMTGAIKLTDFGLARARDRIGKATDGGPLRSKVSYLAPEIVKRQPASPRSDVYSLGCTLWEALAGQRLFDTSIDDEPRRANRAEVRSLGIERPDLPPRLVNLIHRALAIDPAARFASGREMIQELSALLTRAGPDTDHYDELATAIAAARRRERPSDATVA